MVREGEQARPTSTDPATLLSARDIVGLMDVARLIMACAENPPALRQVHSRLDALITHLKPKYLPGLALLEDQLPRVDGDGLLAPAALRSLGLDADDVYFRLAQLLPDGPEPDPSGHLESLVRRKVLSILEPTVLAAMERRLVALQRTLSAASWKSCLDSFEDGVLTVTRDGKVAYQNPRAQELVDLRSVAQPAAQKLRSLIHRFVQGSSAAEPGWLPTETCRGENGEVEIHAVVPPEAAGSGPSPVMHVFLVARPASPLAGGVRAEDFPGLSERELQVLGGLVQGKTLSHVAATLAVGEATARTYRDRLYEKLGISSRRELLLLALRPRPRGT
jgi:DNA-binding CsgD family transcriptional regulator/PAS domain-containing protein